MANTWAVCVASTICFEWWLRQVVGVVMAITAPADLKICEEVKYLESASLAVAPWVQLQFGHLFLEIWAC